MRLGFSGSISLTKPPAYSTTWISAGVLGLSARTTLPPIFWVELMPCTSTKLPFAGAIEHRVKIRGLGGHNEEQADSLCNCDDGPPPSHKQCKSFHN